MVKERNRKNFGTNYGFNEKNPKTTLQEIANLLELYKRAVEMQSKNSENKKW